MTTLPPVGTGLTVSVAVPATLFADVAVMVTLPGATPVATPVASIVAMVLSLLFQVKVVPTTFDDASSAVAVNVCVRPTITVGDAGATVTVTGAPAVEHVFVALAEFRGFGAMTSKSEDVTAVKTQPPPLRIAAVVLLRFAVVPWQSAVAPKPTSSITVAPDGQDVPDTNAVVCCASTTLPADADMGIEPVASGVGGAGDAPVPAASCTR